MAFQHNFVEGWKSVPHPTSESEKISSACFDCSICLDLAHDPVVTLCGHLYCWPCIYKWFDLQCTLPASDEPPRCPVCKSEISLKTMVPLYGNAQALSKSDPEGNSIPPRPAACGLKGLTYLLYPEQQLSSHDMFQNLSSFQTPFAGYEENSSLPLFTLGDSSSSVIYHPMVKMFGEMVCAGGFSNPQSLQAYPNSYHSVANSTPRLRRQQVRADKSLNRITIFLLCCAVLCLLVF